MSARKLPPSGRGSWSEYKDFYPPSRPLPAKGLRARSQHGAIGESWWSQRFIAVLESFGMGGRLDRGKRYARMGQVLSLDISAGKVSALIQGSRALPYRALIRVEPLAEHDWHRVEEAMAQRALFLASLLAGAMPLEIEEAFADCALSLFPANRKDLSTDCNCPDWQNPCKHIAAVCFLLAEAFDDDPFLIFAWRGRTREQLLERLRLLRGGGPDMDAPPQPVHEAWPQSTFGSLDDDLDHFWDSAASLPRSHPQAVAVPDALIRQLDPPDVRIGRARLDEVLGPLYAGIAKAAEQRARTAGS